MHAEPESPQPIDRTPGAASTPGEGTSQAECPYVTGTVTRYCTLTPFTLTDAEREAITTAMNAYGENNDDRECEMIEATLWGLLERTTPSGKKSPETAR
jgi:hypothetical protein